MTKNENNKARQEIRLTVSSHDQEKPLSDGVRRCRPRPGVPKFVREAISSLDRELESRKRDAANPDSCSEPCDPT